MTADTKTETTDTPNSGGVLIQLDQQALNRAKEWYNNFREYVRDVLQKNVDYGIVAGVGKPTLLKPGAEKLRLVFGLSMKMEKTTETLNLDKDFCDVNYLCSIIDRDGRVIWQCEGSASTNEDKYLYRYQLRDKDKNPSKEEADDLKAKKQGRRKKIGNDRRREDKELGENKIGNKNTLQKMAQKRAYVGAILIATGGSEFFTQDVEDMAQFNVVEATVVDPTPATATPTPADARPVQQAIPRSEPEYYEPTEKQINFLNANIQRHGFKKIDRVISKLIQKHYPTKTLKTIGGAGVSELIKKTMNKTDILDAIGVDVEPKDPVDPANIATKPPVENTPAVTSPAKDDDLPR